jgi:NAD-dependent SIR2 family protein deacetylase
VSSIPNPLPPDARTQAHALALRATGTAWLLGAGASAQSGVPTAGQLVDRLLTELYARENNMTVAEVEARPDWLRLVHAAYDGRNGLPPLADTSMYSAVFDRVFPERDIRARWLEDMLDGGRPHFGHHALAAMMAAGVAPLVVTTNFDSLIEDAYDSLRTAVEAPRLTTLAPHNSSNTDYAFATDKSPLLMKIHGDLGTVTPMNTVSELAVGDEILRGGVRSKLSRFGLVVVGYSGRDNAVMAMLSQVLKHDTPYPNGLTWVRRPEDELAPAVSELLEAAHAAGVRPVQELIVANFGELMTHIRRPLTLPGDITNYLEKLCPPPVRRPTVMTAPSSASTLPQVQLCAVEVLAAPAQARLLEVPSKVTADQVRTALRHGHAKASAAKVDSRWLGFGRDADLLAALRQLGGALTEQVVDLDASDSTLAQGLLVEAAALACGHVRGLTPVLRSNRRHQVRVATTRSDAGPSRAQTVLARAVGGAVVGEFRAPGVQTPVPWAEAVTLSLSRVAGRWHLLLTPDIWVRPVGDDPAQRAAAREAGQEFTRERLATRYTSKTGELLRAWVSLLSPEELPVWDVADGAGVPAAFRLASTPLTSTLAPGGEVTVNGGFR